MKTINRLLFLGIAIWSVFYGGQVLAYTIEDRPDVPVLGDFAVGPTKHEIFLNPGETITQELYVMNRLGRAMNFKLDIEDFAGSYDPEQTVVLLGAEKSLYSLKDYMKPEITEFTLSHGQRIFLKVEISVPADAEPGGRYGAILVSTNPSGIQAEDEDGASAGVAVKTRIGSLFFVRVKGAVQENGYLKDFYATIPNGKFYEKGPVAFEIVFQNDGSVHLVPYGLIEITNMFGQKVDELSVDSYFAMPVSLRARQAKWDKNFPIGKYTATLTLNRGYGDIVDQKSATFWVIPWKILAGALALVILIVFFLKWIGSKFEIRWKRKTKP